MLQYSNKFDNKYKKRYLLKNFYVLFFPGVTLIQRQNIFKKHFILKKKNTSNIQDTLLHFLILLSSLIL